MARWWASGDYPDMVETFLLPLGPRLVEASGIGPGNVVLDVAAGTGNALMPAVRVCRPAGTIGLLSWTPRVRLERCSARWGRSLQHSAWRTTSAAVGQRDAPGRVFDDRVDFGTLQRGVLEITAFEKPGDFGEHFKARYGPTIAVQANARQNGRETELDEALDRFCEEWNLGTPESARFEMEYLLAVGTRA